MTSMKSLLFVVTSHDRLGDTGRQTGLWLEELATPYLHFVERGLDPDVASPRGGPAPIDELSRSDPWLTARGRQFLDDSNAMDKLRRTLPVKDLRARPWDAVFLVGGVGAAWDFVDDADLDALVSATFDRGGVVGAICHGVLGLAGARDNRGEPLLRGRSVTGVSNAEERVAEFDRIIPHLPEDRLKALGADYSCAAPFAAHVCQSGRIHTGQNPASAAPLAEAMARAVLADT